MSGLILSFPDVDENICNFLLGSCGCSFLLKGKYRDSLLFGSFTGGLINSPNNLGNHAWFTKAGTIKIPSAFSFSIFCKTQGIKLIGGNAYKFSIFQLHKKTSVPAASGSGL